jgi:hypothetical protein
MTYGPVLSLHAGDIGPSTHNGVTFDSESSQIQDHSQDLIHTEVLFSEHDSSTRLAGIQSCKWKVFKVFQAERILQREFNIHRNTRRAVRGRWGTGGNIARFQDTKKLQKSLSSSLPEGFSCLHPNSK